MTPMDWITLLVLVAGAGTLAAAPAIAIIGLVRVLAEARRMGR